jgi:hypothetical protein
MKFTLLEETHMGASRVGARCVWVGWEGDHRHAHYADTNTIPVSQT